MNDNKTLKIFGLAVFTLMILVMMQSLIQAALAEDQSPRIELSEYSWHLGTYPQYTFVYHELEIYNTGTADLIINDIVSSCACAVLDMDEYPLSIPPGGSHTVNISFDTINYVDEVYKYINIMSNDPTNSSLTVGFWCIVLPPETNFTAVTFTFTVTTTTVTTPLPTTTAESPAIAIPVAVLAFAAVIVIAWKKKN